MPDTALVERAQDAGERLVKALDRKYFPVSGALWLLDSDEEVWRLIIASPIVDENGPRQAYKRLQQVLATERALPTKLSDITLVGTDDPLIAVLSQAVHTGPTISRVRFTNNVINGVLVSDALIYRLSTVGELQSHQPQDSAKGT